MALFFFNTKGVSTIKKGQYFGMESEFCQKVFEEYCKLFNFKGMKIVTAMREFFNNFDLNGEGQKIDRIL